MARDDADVGLRLARKAAAACEPGFDLAGAGIVGGCGEAEVAAECRAQFAQVARRIAQRLQRLERVDEPTHRGGPRHELRDALRAGRADRAGSKRLSCQMRRVKNSSGSSLSAAACAERRADVVNRGTRPLLLAPRSILWSSHCLRRGRPRLVARRTRASLRHGSSQYRARCREP